LPAAAVTAKRRPPNGLLAGDGAHLVRGQRYRRWEQPHIAGAAAGLGAEEATRRSLSATEVADIVQAEISERLLGRRIMNAAVTLNGRSAFAAKQVHSCRRLRCWPNAGEISALM
jgi:hypothetical protein